MPAGNPWVDLDSRFAHWQYRCLRWNPTRMPDGAHERIAAENWQQRYEEFNGVWPTIALEQWHTWREFIEPFEDDEFSLVSELAHELYCYLRWRRSQVPKAARRRLYREKWRERYERHHGLDETIAEQDWQNWLTLMAEIDAADLSRRPVGSSTRPSALTAKPSPLSSRSRE